MRLIPLALLTAGCSLGPSFDGAIDLESALALDQLAVDRSATLTAFQVSSRAPGHSNADYGEEAPGNSVIRVDEQGRYVIFDERGPGVLTRMWFTDFSVRSASNRDEALTTIPGNIWFSVDGEEVLNAPMTELFSGELAGFPSPLIGNPDLSSGGYFSYLPMPYQQRMVVSVDHLIPYLQLSGHEVRGRDVESWDGSFEPQLAMQAADDWERTEWDAPSETLSTVLPPGGEARLDLEGPGVLQRVQLRFDPPLDAFPELTLRVRVDGELAVDAPFGLFFLVPMQQVSARGRLVGHEDGLYYSNLPIPFGESLELEVVSADGVERQLTIEHQRSEGPVDDLLRFQTQHNEGTTEDLGGMHLLAQAEGRGHLVATTALLCSRDLRAEGGSGPSHYYLEGDELIWVDGGTQPDLTGTGTEDYFNGGFYYAFGTPFDLPSHGMPDATDAQIVPELPAQAANCTSQYRQRLVDPLPFRKSLRFELERGGLAATPSWYSTLTYLYVSPS